MIWLALIAALAIGYVAGSLRTFAFCGYWSETLRHVAATLEPRCGGWWRGERVFFQHNQRAERWSDEEIAALLAHNAPAAAPNLLPIRSQDIIWGEATLDPKLADRLTRKDGE